MNSKNLTMIGLTGLLAALVLANVGTLTFASDEMVALWQSIALKSAAVALLGAMLLKVFESFNRQRDGRCMDCGVSVPVGHTLCREHLQTRCRAKRDELRGARLA
ncbi:MAG: hypothetical protein AAF533_22415 [Acidobacteriota bacterium]